MVEAVLPSPAPRDKLKERTIIAAIGERLRSTAPSLIQVVLAAFDHPMLQQTRCIGLHSSAQGEGRFLKHPQGCFEIW